MVLQHQLLPAPESDDYKVDWLDLFSISKKERVDIGHKRAEAIRSYTSNPAAEGILPPDGFLELCLGLSQAQIDLIKKMIADGISEEQKDLFEEVEKSQGQPVKPAATTIPEE